MSSSYRAAASATAHDQTLRKILLLVLLAAGIGFLLVGGSRWSDGHWMHETIEWIGIVLVVACIVGRTWTSLYIGGRKNSDLVVHGPYSISRNPLYLFSIVGAAGIGAQVGSVTAALVCSIIAWAIFLWTARFEEAALEQAFADAYRQYSARVPRFWPRLSLWNAPKTIEIYPRLVVTTFADALFFLVAIPLAEGVEYLQAIGILPVLIQIP